MQSEPNNLPLRARTWHSLLGIGSNSETGGWSFARTEESPFPFRLLIGDESSMMDLSLMLAVMRARGAGCHVLLVGDVNQLPPVGNGAPLRDLIAAGLPYGELREIKRNSGGIVEACAAIRDSLPWLEFAEQEDSNIEITGDTDQEAKVARILRLLGQAEAAGYDPVWDCQVVVAVNESSVLSRKLLNLELQDACNPNPKVEGTVFREGDKVVCLKNGFCKNWDTSIPVDEDTRTNDRNELYVANGELGEVMAFDGGCVVINLESPARVVAIPIRKQSSEDDGDSKGSLGNWDLGYALSVHKSQGSEWQVVIVALDSYSGAKMICDRAWIYTAISRARKKCFLVGPGELAERFCTVQKIGQRKTFLKERILRERFLQEVDQL
jgi:exodeoxyribonuclease V alpha subunit